MQGKNTPSEIKQDGYIAKWNGKFYEVEYMKGGHLPGIGFILLTHEEMGIIYRDKSQYSAVMVSAEKEQESRNENNTSAD